MNKINLLLNALESKIPQEQVVNHSISNGSVGWHIEHCLLVIESIIAKLKATDPKNYIWKFSLKKMLVFTLNKIPRGKGKAPDRVTPRTKVTEESLKAHLTKTAEKLNELASIEPNCFIEHPVFGLLNKKTSLQFIQIHTEHHLKIIEDILNKR